jgi:hypothetical protein
MPLTGWRGQGVPGVFGVSWGGPHVIAPYCIAREVIRFVLIAVSFTYVKHALNIPAFAKSLLKLFWIRF